MRRAITKVKKGIVNMAKKAASMEANTACALMNFQPKESENIKKLRKF